MLPTNYLIRKFYYFVSQSCYVYVPFYLFLTRINASREPRAPGLGFMRDSPFWESVLTKTAGVFFHTLCGENPRTLSHSSAELYANLRYHFWFTPKYFLFILLYFFLFCKFYLDEATSSVLLYTENWWKDVVSHVV